MFLYCCLCSKNSVSFDEGLPCICPDHINYNSEEDFQGFCPSQFNLYQGQNILHGIAAALQGNDPPLDKLAEEDSKNHQSVGTLQPTPSLDLNYNHFNSFSNDPPVFFQEIFDASALGASTNLSNMKESEETQKVEKNQYDKNIPGNIVSTVLSQMISGKYNREIQFYCKSLQTSFLKVMDFARKNQDGKKKIGTSWIGDCFSEKNDQNKIHKVFGLFLVRFLREQYFLHILSIGKMREKQKYLECATKLMYVPRLQKHEYKLISRFQ